MSEERVRDSITFYLSLALNHKLSFSINCQKWPATAKTADGNTAAAALVDALSTVRAEATMTTMSLGLSLGLSRDRTTTSAAVWCARNEAGEIKSLRGQAL